MFLVLLQRTGPQTHPKHIEMIMYWKYIWFVAQVLNVCGCWTASDCSQCSVLCFLVFLNYLLMMVKTRQFSIIEDGADNLYWEFTLVPLQTISVYYVWKPYLCNKLYTPPTLT